MKLGAFGLAATIVASPAIAQPVEAEQARVEVQPVSTAQPAATGRIIIYRTPTLFGAAVACPVRHKGSEIVELGRGKYAEWEVPAGRYILTNRSSSVEVAVDAGVARYVRCTVRANGLLEGHADLQLVDEESFAERAHQLQKKPLAAAP